MKRKTHKKCGPDSETLGMELADYLRDKWNALPKRIQDAVLLGFGDTENAVYYTMRLRWEMEFWRGKVLKNARII